MIEISHLVKKYGDHYAVRDLTVTIQDGQIYGFLGPNGAGKSTTMNIITGYLAPTSGEVKVNGHDIMKEPEEAKKTIGYLPEMPPLYQEMTVEEYLRFAAQLKKLPASRRAESVEAAIQTAQLADVRKRLIANLSKGYKQRVGLAQAVLGDPRVVILDEPTVGLDPKQMIEIRELIVKLKEKHTVILSSHILSEVSAVCDQILILSKGRLVASDTPQGLQEKMQGAVCLELEVRGDREPMQRLLQKLDGVERFAFADAPEGETKVSIWEKSGSDVRADLFFGLADYGMPILSLQRSKESLEDIFLQLTEANPNGQDAGKEKKRKHLFADRKKGSEEAAVTAGDPAAEAASGAAAGDLPDSGMAEDVSGSAAADDLPDSGMAEAVSESAAAGDLSDSGTAEAVSGGIQQETDAAGAKGGDAQ